MKDNKFNIVVVDDSMDKNDPLVVELTLDFPDATVSFFEHIEHAMKFVEDHMSERIIIFMDCLFGSAWKGVEAVLKLREKTSLIYVVMMSANNPNTFTSELVTALINTDNIYFIRNTDVEGAKTKVKQIQSLWKSQFDCILERWLVKHPENEDKEAYRVAGGKSFTWADILRELRLRTEVGRSYEQMLNEYYISQLELIKK